MRARPFALVFLVFSLIAASVWAGDANKAPVPGTDDMSRYVATKAPLGGQTTIRDASGRTIGTASTTGSRTTFRDGSGRTAGTASTEGSQTVFRDASGRTVWTATKSGSQTTYRDASGQHPEKRLRYRRIDDLPRCQWPHEQHCSAERVRRYRKGCQWQNRKHEFNHGSRAASRREKPKHSWQSWETLIRLQVLLLPPQAGSSGPGNEPDLASAVLYLRMLSGVVAFDRRGLSYSLGQ